MLLNYQYQQAKSETHQGTLVFIHGLFGSLSNLGMLVRAFENDYAIVQLDLRNHGESGHDDQIDYMVMAQDVLETLAHLNIQQFSVIGHSMGGKVAMKLTEIAGERLESIAILDIAPFAYQQRHHDQIFEALIAVEQAQVSTRKEATEIMQSYIQEMGVIQFLLKSFQQGQWKFNVKALLAHYENITSWQEIEPWMKPTLFLKGEHSDYISQDAHFESIQDQFPFSQLIIIKNAGHWLHAEQTIEVTDQIKRFFQ